MRIQSLLGVALVVLGVEVSARALRVEERGGLLRRDLELEDGANTTTGGGKQEDEVLVEMGMKGSNGERRLRLRSKRGRR